MYQATHPHDAAKIIRELAPNHQPLIAIVLGSGLGALADQLEEAVTIPYDRLPGFPKAGGVKGHEGKLVLGTLNGTSVVCLQGRSHLYETGSYDEVKTYVRTLKVLGCQYFLATNAVGSFHAHVGSGSLVLIHDHINFQVGNPLIGPNDDDFGPRFPAMDKTYDSELRVLLQERAAEINISLNEGVYLAVSGPSYETTAEIHAYRLLGADVVGMSTVPEVIVANHCGLRIAVISTVTNLVTGLSPDSHDHDSVVAVANRAAAQLTQLITAFVGSVHDKSIA